ncbi:MAG: hypothetical protein MRY32_06615 [Rickettsiales bacterium]|nr:hypothetical protein [Rickettsiales bacterium]
MKQTERKELQEKIDELQAKLDSLPDEKLNPVFHPKAGERYHEIEQRGGNEGLSTDYFTACSDRTQAYFRTSEAALAYGEAFQTILELHALSDWDGKCGVISSDGCVTSVLDMLSTEPWGRFANKTKTQAAIDKIGKERIEKAVTVLCRGQVV